MELGGFSGSGWSWSPGFWVWQGLALGWGRIEHLPASCSLFPEGGEWGGVLWPCLHPTPLALILTLLLRVISLALFPFLGGRRGREAGRLGRGWGRILEQQAGPGEMAALPWRFQLI